MDWHFASALPGIAWPGIPGVSAATTLALALQLEQSQWLSPQRLRERQMEQLERLLEHARKTVPYYRERLASAETSEFERLPVLTTRHVQDHYEALKSERVPASHGASGEVRSSGSTGAPKRVLKTRLLQVLWEAISLREHSWHRRDLSRKLAVIRRGSKGTQPFWGAATAGIFVTGPAVGLPLEAETSAEAQVEWLQREDPGYVLTYPSVLGELARVCLSSGTRLPGLIQARTLSETVTPELRRLCHEAWGVPLIDMYSSEEVGYIALQCPEHDRYHVQAETLLVEVLDERGSPCAPGEVGRVVVTDLHNFATPLIRYEIGDFAEAGAPCACGRGLPVLSRIIGRARNLLVTADGKRRYPFIGQSEYLDIAPILQHQLVQTSLHTVEARIVMREAPTAQQVERLRAHIARRMPAGIRIEVVRVESLPRGAGGKYEDFISLVSP